MFLLKDIENIFVETRLHHLFETENVCKILNDFTVTFD